MKISGFTKTVVIVNCAVPVSLLAWDGATSHLGANPVNFAIRTTGLLSLIFLVLSLTVTPVTRLADWSWLAPFRRVLGLYAFFHAVLHFSLFFLFDRAGNIVDTLSEMTMRPYLVVGMTGLLVMVPLAVTSTNRMIRRLGPKRWKLLHRLAYVAAITGALHFYMLVKADTARPIAFASVLGLLVAYRMIAHYLQLRSDSRKYRSSNPQAKANRSSKLWTGELRVAKVFVETPDVRTFRLVMPSDERLPFVHLPGQYLNLTVEIDGRKVRRSYTIASSPSRDRYCELTVKREEKGLVSRYLHESLREGSMLAVSAPAGKFTFTGIEAERIVLIAGGVGITPLMAVIRHLTDLGWPGAMHLIYSVKTERDLIFRSELDELQKRFANLKVTVTLTREHPTAWGGERGRISSSLLARVEPELARSLIHLCGPTEMTEPVIAMLRDLGVPADSIKVESFVSPSRNAAGGAMPLASPSGAAAESSAERSHATLQFARTSKTVSELDDATILEIAERHGIDIPYDCRSAVCGQCKVKLLAGSVVMDAEDALDVRDRENGVILSCQARCRDDVVIDV